MDYKGIGDYGLIGDGHSVCLVGMDGSIDWACFPRFDSPSVFAALLDAEAGGRFSITPVQPAFAHQAYVQDTNVLVTEYEAEEGEGTVTLTDFMPCYRTGRGARAFHEVHRIVRCEAGEMTLEATFRPRFDYGWGVPELTPHRWGVTARHGADALTLSADVPLEVQEEARAQFTLRAGEEALFVLRWGDGRARSLAAFRTEEKLRRTIEFWEEKASGCQVHGPYRDWIIRSYLALHLLIYSPTGAIVAAPTTSLPEKIGGERNWDYRYSWLRDSAFTLRAFFSVHHLEEAEGFMRWLARTCFACGENVQILYGVDMEREIEEWTVEGLEGYRGSRPVRVGNQAYKQRQLDIYGEVLNSAYIYLTHGGRISRQIWRMLRQFVEIARSEWREPDSGIWEVRSGPYQFVYSKVMCWVAIDRGIRIAEALGERRFLRAWRKTADEVRREVLIRGWNEERGAFVQHYGTTALDASALLLPLVGFLPANEPRMRSTIERIVEELTVNGMVRRYDTEKTDDGLSGPEGGFSLCTFWLVRDLLRLDRVEEAQELYESMIDRANHLGLLSEMVDLETGGLLGNFPQAFTHVAVIIAGQELTEKLEEVGTPPPQGVHAEHEGEIALW